MSYNILRGHQRSLEVKTGHKWPRTLETDYDTYKCNFFHLPRGQKSLEIKMSLKILRGHQRSQEVKRGHMRSRIYKNLRGHLRVLEVKRSHKRSQPFHLKYNTYQDNRGALRKWLNKRFLEVIKGHLRSKEVTEVQETSECNFLLVSSYIMQNVFF